MSFPKSVACICRLELATRLHGFGVSEGVRVAGAGFMAEGVSPNSPPHPTTLETLTSETLSGRTSVLSPS